MKGTAEEIAHDFEPEILEMTLIRKRGRHRFMIAKYVFEKPLTIARVIHALNDNIENPPILQGYLEWLEERARAECEAALERAIK